MKIDLIPDLPIIDEVGELAYVMWNRGWDERNGGNISCLLSEKEIEKLDLNKSTNRTCIMENIPENLRGSYILVTASGSYFKNVKNDLSNCLGVIKLSQEGNSYDIIWGYEDGGLPTSELYTHLLSHSSRLMIDKNHKVIVHNHATHISAMTFVHPLIEEKLIRTLWGIITECLIVFPDGLGLLPWMICGNEQIGLATAEKMKESRIVIWPYHGILATGTSLDDAFGLIETVNKAAEIYMLTYQNKSEGISDQQLKELGVAFNVTPRRGILKV